MATKRTGVPVVEFGKPFMIAGFKTPAIINQVSTLEDPDSVEIKINGYNRVSKHV